MNNLLSLAVLLATAACGAVPKRSKDKLYPQEHHEPPPSTENVFKNQMHYCSTLDGALNTTIQDTVEQLFVLSYANSYKLKSKSLFPEPLNRHKYIIESADNETLYFLYAILLVKLDTMVPNDLDMCHQRIGVKNVILFRHPEYGPVNKYKWNDSTLTRLTESFIRTRTEIGSSMRDNEVISAIHVLLLTTGSLAKLPIAQQEIIIRNLTAHEVARFLAISFLCCIPDGVLRCLDSVLAVKNYSLNILALCANLLLKQKTSVLALRQYSKDRLIEACQRGFREDLGIPRRCWWYICILSTMCREDASLFNYMAIDFKNSQAFTAECFVVRREWRRETFIEQLLHQAREFRSVIVQAHRPCYPAPMKATVHFRFFKYCIPEEHFDTALLQLRRALEVLPFIEKGYPHYCASLRQAILKHVKDIVRSWLLNKQATGAYLIKLFHTLLNKTSPFGSLVPELLEECNKQETDRLLQNPLTERLAFFLSACDYPPGLTEQSVLKFICRAKDHHRARSFTDHALPVELYAKIRPLYAFAVLTSFLHYWILSRGSLNQKYASEFPWAEDIFREQPWDALFLYLLSNTKVLMFIDNPIGQPARPAVPYTVSNLLSEWLPGSIEDLCGHENISRVSHLLSVVWIGQLYAIVASDSGVAGVMDSLPQRMFDEQGRPNITLCWRFNLLAALARLQRVRDMIRQNIIDHPDLIQVAVIIWRSIPKMADTSRVVSMPTFPMLLCGGNLEDNVCVDTVTAIAMLRVSRLVLDALCTYFMAVPADCPADAVQQGIAALILNAILHKCEPIALESLRQLNTFMSIPSVVDAFKGHSEAIRDSVREAVAKMSTSSAILNNEIGFENIKSALRDASEGSEDAR